MGFCVYYRSTQPLTTTEAGTIREVAHAASSGRTWLSCEPVSFFSEGDGGHLLGGSKPNYLMHPDDIAAAAREGLPDGTTRDVLDILCRLSREYGVDWEISHDESRGPIGYIRAGVCDNKVLSQMEAFADLSVFLRDLEFDKDA